MLRGARIDPVAMPVIAWPPAPVLRSERSADLPGAGVPGVTMCAMSTTDAPAGATGTRDASRDAVIHTEDLTKVYPGTDFAAVDRLNLDVAAGEIFGLLGPNGAGKTTTAGMLTTRVVPTAGRAFIAGVDVAAHPALAK